MAPMSSSEAMTYSAEQQQRVLRLAADAIESGLRQQRYDPELKALDEALRAERASFVTLQLDGQLRGCIGSLEAFRPLATAVAGNAWAAAFRDPRFLPVTRPEAGRLEIHVSVLSVPEAMVFESEADLLAQLRPFVDGLVLQEGGLRGTFLPSVWETLPDPADFLRQLKRKAGLPQDYWSSSLRISRYSTQSIPG
jgi:AmmeMemoRadiSam system protein A